MKQEKRYKHLYPTAFMLYVTFFVHGFGAAIIGQNVTSLQQQWGTTAAGVVAVTSALGIGRLITYPFSGALSDRFGRRPITLIGSFVYVLFFAGILVSPNAQVGYFVAMLCGVANGFLDSGVIPGAMEILEDSGLASILTKLVISIAQYILPMMIAYLLANDMWYGWTFVFCIVILIVNALLLTRAKFAPQPKVETENGEKVKGFVGVSKASKFAVEGIALIVIGYTCTATFQIFLAVNKSYGMDVLGMTEGAAGQIQSMYSLGSILMVVATTFLLKWIKPVKFILICPIIAGATEFLMFVSRNTTLAVAGGFIVGATAAGGVLQLVTATMTDLFPASKAKCVSAVMIAGALSQFSATVMASKLAEMFGMEYSLLVAVGFTVLGIVLAVIVNIRYAVIEKSLAAEGKSL